MTSILWKRIITKTNKLEHKYRKVHIIKDINLWFGIMAMKSTENYTDIIKKWMAWPTTSISNTLDNIYIILKIRNSICFYEHETS